MPVGSQCKAGKHRQISSLNDKNKIYKIKTTTTKKGTSKKRKSKNIKNSHNLVQYKGNLELRGCKAFLCFLIVNLTCKQEVLAGTVVAASQTRRATTIGSFPKKFPTVTKVHRHFLSDHITKTTCHRGVGTRPNCKIVRFVVVEL